MSRNDIVLLACGSRSIRSVGLPRRARAAARLMAVVVLPTPPFWFAIATIIGDADCKQRRGRRQGEVAEESLFGSFGPIRYILYLPMSSGSRLSSHFWSRSVSTSEVTGSL